MRGRIDIVDAGEDLDLSYLSDSGWYNDVYLPSYDDQSRTKIFYGSRDSGKSQHIGQELVHDCLSLSYFKAILSRRYQNTIKDSQWQTIKDIVEDWELDDYFKFTKSPLEIECTLNGNKFICRGLDNASKLKSVKDPTHFWGEEFDECSEEDYETISLSLRNSKGIKIKEYISFNSSSFKHWIPEYFFPPEEEFKKYEKPDGLFTYVPSKLKNVSILHTCYKHNQFITDERIENIERTKETKPARYKKNALGLFVDDVDGALWNYAMIHENRISSEKYKSLPVFREVIALDPSDSGKKEADEAGIVCAASAKIRGEMNYYAFLDESGLYSVSEQSQKVIDTYERLGLDAIIIEKNFGGNWIPETMKSIGGNRLNIQLVNASKSKKTRAEPVAELYERGLVHHVGFIPKLEDEMTTWVPWKSPNSPNRIDALVWAISFLMEPPKRKRRLRPLTA